MTELRKIVFPGRNHPEEIWGRGGGELRLDRLPLGHPWGVLAKSGREVELVYDILKSKKATRQLIRKPRAIRSQAV